MNSSETSVVRHWVGKMWVPKMRVICRAYRITNGALVGIRLIHLPADFVCFPTVTYFLNFLQFYRFFPIHRRKYYLWIWDLWTKISKFRVTWMLSNYSQIEILLENKLLQSIVYVAFFENYLHQTTTSFSDSKKLSQELEGIYNYVTSLTLLRKVKS